MSEVVVTDRGCSAWKRRAPCLCAPSPPESRGDRAHSRQFLNTLPEVSTAFTESIQGKPVGRAIQPCSAWAPGGHDARTAERQATGVRRREHRQVLRPQLYSRRAIERIEIIPGRLVCCSGSDALAGVVNIILKTDFDGAQLNTRYGAASGVWEKSVDAAWGNTWDHARPSRLSAASSSEAVWFRRARDQCEQRLQALWRRGPA